jgi:hypothetical protein
MTSTAALLGAVVAILTAVGVIGGGGGGAPHDASTPAASSQAPASWASQANAVCARTNDTVAALPSPTTLARSDIASYLRTALVLEQRMLRELNALQPPQGKASQVAAFLALGAKMNDATGELADDVAVGDLGRLRGRAVLLSRLNTRFNDAAVALGASTCAEGSSLSDVFGS